MALDPDKRPPRRKRGSPAAFRFAEEPLKKLKILSEAFGWTQVEILEELISMEFEEIKKQNPSLIKKKTSKLNKQTS